MDRHICSKMPETFQSVSVDWRIEREPSGLLIWLRVLDHVDRDAGVTPRQVGEELIVLHLTIWRVLHEQLLYP
jgi:hypothetical protein